MTLYEFNALPYDRQLVAVFDTGTFLATRWEGEDAVNLYHLASGVFVELYYDTYRNKITNLRAFTSTAQLQSYTLYVLLPENLSGMTTSSRRMETVQLPQGSLSARRLEIRALR